jgi:hypothetical protein
VGESPPSAQARAALARAARRSRAPGPILALALLAAACLVFDIAVGAPHATGH